MAREPREAGLPGDPSGPHPGPLLDVRQVSARYESPRRRLIGRRGRRGAPSPAAAEQLVVRDVSFTVNRGDSVGLVGESGSGKTTLGLCVVGLLPIVTGEILYRGAVASSPGKRAQVPRVRGVQAVYQDPNSALNPRRTVGSLIREVLRVHRLVPRSGARARCVELLDAVGLPASVIPRRSAELSGGMCQRVAIARALAFEPQLLIADEVVSSLDASVQAQVLNLLADLRAELGLAILLITHDLAVVSQACERIMVMWSGEIRERGSTEDVLRAPEHEYTKALLQASPAIASTP